MTRIYLDRCCSGRLFDDQSQQRVRDEADVVEAIIGAVEKNRLELFSSEFLYLELSKHPDSSHRVMCLSILDRLSAPVPSSPSVLAMAASFRSLGLTGVDAAHAASALEANADVQTVDDILLRRIQRHAATIPTPVDNPPARVRRRFPHGL